MAGSDGRPAVRVKRNIHNYPKPFFPWTPGTGHRTGTSAVKTIAVDGTGFDTGNEGTGAGVFDGGGGRDGADHADRCCRSGRDSHRRLVLGGLDRQRRGEVVPGARVGDGRVHPEQGEQDVTSGTAYSDAARPAGTWHYRSSP